jgi:hypothetical protein
MARPEEHWQAGVDTLAQIEQQLARYGTGEVDDSLFRVSLLNLLAALSGAQLQQHLPARFSELMQPGVTPARRAAAMDAYPGVPDTGGDGG